jgi:hypothetical protein
VTGRTVAFMVEASEFATENPADEEKAAENGAAGDEHPATAIAKKARETKSQ